MEEDVRRAINDLSNATAAELNKMIESYNEAITGLGEVIEALIKDHAKTRKYVMDMDKTMSHVATRLDQLEGIAGLDDPTKED